MTEQSMINTILGAGAGAFLAWGLTKCVSYYVVRQRLKSYIVTVINIYLSQFKENRAWLDSYMDQAFRKDTAVDGAPFYTRDEFQDLKSINIDNLLYLTRAEQIQLTNLIANLSEAEILFEGFCRSLKELQDERVIINSSKYDFMTSRATRILELTSLFPDKIENLDKLRYGYHSKIPPKELIPNTSNTQQGD